jgi:hypothetical protein
LVVATTLIDCPARNVPLAVDEENAEIVGADVSTTRGNAVADVRTSVTPSR